MTTITKLPIRVALPGRGALSAIRGNLAHHRCPGCGAGMHQTHPCFPGCHLDTADTSDIGERGLFDRPDDLWAAERRRVVAERLAELGQPSGQDTETLKEETW